MSDAVIRVDDLGKRYVIAHQRAPYTTLRDTLAKAATGLPRRLLAPFRGDRRPGPGREEFWALRDISFAIPQGQAVAIIGRNGAGKSTLLKLLSRITEPTAGRIELHGRVASLLEVGTGFHGELTGRENVFLNGAILGMYRSEIRRRFDDIVSFAGVERFLDTPVKHYSSGMYVRLAFAVAAHLDPEILIVDEVLAVGDVAFQRKCMGKMSEVARGGRTVLFVSHNLTAVRSLCSRGIVIDKGRVVLDAPIEQATNFYIKSLGSERDLDKAGLANRLGRTSGAVRFSAISLRDEQDKQKWLFQAGETVRVCLTYKAYERVPSLGLYLNLRSGVTREVLTSIKTAISEGEVREGYEGTVVVTLPNLLLRPGDYLLYICLGTSDCNKFYDVIDENASLPCLTVGSEEKDPHRTAGYFSHPFRVQTTANGS